MHRDTAAGKALDGLHQLCTPMLDRMQHLPGPQRDALQTAFGLRAGEPPDRFLVRLAVLSLLADVVGLPGGRAAV